VVILHVNIFNYKGCVSSQDSYMMHCGVTQEISIA
jgi:hypothetical protein